VECLHRAQKRSIFIESCRLWRHRKMRVQVAVYLHPDTKKWLEVYGNRLGMTQSEVALALIEREQEVGWLQWALKAPDPAQKAHRTLKGPGSRLPRRFDSPPTP